MRIEANGERLGRVEHKLVAPRPCIGGPRRQKPAQVASDAGCAAAQLSGVDADAHQVVARFRIGPATAFWTRRSIASWYVSYTRRAVRSHRNWRARSTPLAAQAAANASSLSMR